MRPNFFGQIGLLTELLVFQLKQENLSTMHAQNSC